MFILLLLGFAFPQGRAAEVSIADFLNSAWEYSPVRKGEGFQSEASTEFESSVRGKFLPHVSLDAIDSTGFPASNSRLGVSGLMGSPFRSGLAGGVVVEQMVYDFGRIESLLERAKADRSLAVARLSESKFRFLVQAARVYLDCARSRSLQQDDEELVSWTKVNLRETARFTKTGQRSIVDNSLVKTELNQLQLELDQIQKFQRSLTEQMRLYGVQGECRGLPDSWRFTLTDSLRVEEPSVLIARAQIESAQASLNLAKAAQLPELKVMGSLGGMDHSRLVEQQDYSAGVGLTFPIWNGAEDYRKQEAFKSQIDYQTENLKAAQLEYSVRLTALRDEFQRESEALIAADSDLQQVRKTIELASKRYRTLEGTLIDVREALRQLRELGLERLRIMNALGQASVQLSILKGKKDNL